MQDLGFWLLNTVTWYRPNAMPNFRGARLKNDVEFIIWAKRSESSRHPYNHQFMKQFNDGKQLGSVWEIPTCVGKERLRDERGKKLHPTQKPEELLKRILLASSQPGNLVLDPFVGTGTTAVVAKRLHRHWIGIEQDEVYYRAAQKRLARVAPLPLDNEFLQPLVPVKHKRLPFRKLLEYEILRAGQTLYLDDPACTAVILENGWLQSNGYCGSIHKMACLLKEVPTCNGWVHWHYQDEETGGYAPIDMLRQQVRRQLLPHKGKDNLQGSPFEEIE
jgi:modification methylase